MLKRWQFSPAIYPGHGDFVHFRVLEKKRNKIIIDQKNYEKNNHGSFPLPLFPK